MDVDEPEEKKEKVAPLGGGKPFRLIRGKPYVIDGDEFVTEDDPKGDEKIDKWGNLLGGRRFKAPTFALPNRHPQRQYMLAIEAARTSGFRDSLYYFRRNPLAFKLNATQPEKDYLIGEGKLGSTLRTRSVTLITARSAYKLHGSKMVIDGRWVVDDYYEDNVLAEITARGLKPGDLVGDVTDPADPALAASKQSKQNALDALGNSSLTNASSLANVGGSGGTGSSIYRPGGPTTIFGGSGYGPFSDGPLNAVRKSLLSRDNVDEDNWMKRMAEKVREADEEWGRTRKEGIKPSGGVNPVLGGPMATTGMGKTGTAPPVSGGDAVRAGTAEPNEPAAKKRKVAFQNVDDKVSPLPLGTYEPHSGLVFYRSDTQPTRARMEPVFPSPSTSTSSNSIASKIKDKRPILGGTKTGNNAWGIAWIDTIMELPPHPSFSPSSSSSSSSSSPSTASTSTLPYSSPYFQNTSSKQPAYGLSSLYSGRKALNKTDRSERERRRILEDVRKKYGDEVLRPAPGTKVDSSSSSISGNGKSRRTKSKSRERTVEKEGGGGGGGGGGRGGKEMQREQREESMSMVVDSGT
ncbi:hypothetical protein K435DRAFT_646613 [Dendrothele bispora CBS 962.96]|uniref:Uncharacterized protein n=1 Tax=Dendrothele bispora (strain CBS 962.96) TaxID=1314807 RepID=A0A4S8MRH8_DENBC|nr:hypothetical protein K435DRAFT_646613 [Dendrothele bispora CBS 962.96]